jgi:hypothetical protein
MGVEKLPRRKIAEKTLRWEALQTTISVFVDIFGKRDHAGGNRRVNPIAAFTLMVETKPVGHTRKPRNRNSKRSAALA